MTGQPQDEIEVQIAKARGKARGAAAEVHYRPKFAEHALHLTRLGATDTDLAAFFHVHIQSIWHWRAKHPEFRKSLKVGKAEADERVERSLYMRGLGYSYDAVKIFMPAGAKKPVYAPYVEHVPPDVTACIFWLKNRKPAEWRDAWQLEHVLGKYHISDKPMTEDEWIDARATVIDQPRIEDKQNGGKQ